MRDYIIKALELVESGIAIFMRKINVTKYIDKLRHALRKHTEEVIDR